MGQKTSVFAPYFLPVSQMTSGFGQMKTEKSEGWQMKKSLSSFLYMPVFTSKTKEWPVLFVFYATNKTGLFCVHI